MNVIVLGAGVAGLASGLAMARTGHTVTIVERDSVEDTDASEAPSWERNGIPHFLQPHAFLPRGRKEMIEQFPDVYRALIEAGASDIDMRSRMNGAPPEPGDEFLVFLGVRRPLIEWALRRAVLAEPSVTVRGGVHSRGFTGRAGTVPVIDGLTTDDGSLSADLVVDASGRRSHAAEWLKQLGASAPEEERTNCGVMYYTRYYQLRPDFQIPAGPWIPSPRGDLGYGAFASFPGDSHTFGVVLAVPPHDRALRGLKEPAAYEAAIRSIPALAACIDGGDARPITGVLPMGSLQNTIRRFVHDGEPVALGLIPVGDALCHTDPVGALGLSFSLIHARVLADAASAHAGDAETITRAYLANTSAEAEERFALMSAIDDARARMWAGEPVDLAHRDGCYPMFALAAATAAGFEDPDIFRLAVRRIGFLDRTKVFDDDVAAQERVEKIFGDIMARPRPKPGPTRDELVSIVEAAV